MYTGKTAIFEGASSKLQYIWFITPLPTSMYIYLDQYISI